MTDASAWPRWLSEENRFRVRSIGGGLFSWTVGNESVATASALTGRWVCEHSGIEIDVCLRRDVPDRCVVGKFPLGDGFWLADSEPSGDNSDASFTGSIDAVLDRADLWTREEVPDDEQTQ